MKIKLDHLLYFLAFALFLVGGFFINQYIMTPSASDLAKLSADEMEQWIVNENVDIDSRYSELIKWARRDLYPAECHSIINIYNQSANETIQRGALLSAGYIAKPDCISFLKKILSDQNTYYQLRALEALSFAETTELGPFLEDYLGTEKVGEVTRIYGYLVLAKNSELDKQAILIKKLTDSLGAIDAANQQSVFGRLLNLFPEDEHLLNYVREKVYSGKNEAFVIMGLKHLSALKDPWVGTNFERFIYHKNPRIRSSVIESLRYLCPKNRWELLKTAFLKEDEPDVLKKIINEVIFIGGNGSRSIYNQLLDLAPEKAQMNVELIRENQLKIERTKSIGLCKN